jgi:Coenzyme PQQ synthesis protein D (PqqD)
LEHAVLPIDPNSNFRWPSALESVDGSPVLLRFSEGVIAKRLGAGAVLVHITTNRIFELNETGAYVCELLQKGADRAHIVNCITAEFDVEADRAAAEVNTLLGALQSHGLLA